MTRLKIAKEEDRIAVAGILIKNGYTVRQAKTRRGKGNAYDYFVECELQGTQIGEKVKNEDQG